MSQVVGPHKLAVLYIFYLMWGADRGHVLFPWSFSAVPTPHCLGMRLSLIIGSYYEFYELFANLACCPQVQDLSYLLKTNEQQKALQW